MKYNYFKMSERYKGEPQPNYYVAQRDVTGLITTIWVEIEKPSVLARIHPFNDVEQRYMVVCKAHAVQDNGELSEHTGVSPIAGGLINPNVIADFSRIAVCRAVLEAKKAAKKTFLHKNQRSSRDPMVREVAYKRLEPGEIASIKKPTHH